ncbi:methyltransferase domain-containing protein [Halovivax limisalsi]|uniref:methyltransferase domain-containing protein n=1 Tax=Halovivax limisalsi TaxID=1453760 RepID=UPI001FFDDB8E|nr:methyltransferase domain-containing protein [Halovivax limisalsi]
MSDPATYDRDAAERESAAYESPAAAERRSLVRDRLAPRPGETVLSIGCGPGFEPAEIAPLVGREGHVHGVDRSEAMLDLAVRRCADAPNASLACGEATDLPISTGSIDAAVAVQVYEYVEPLDAALAELERVLRPGGRAAVYDTDFASLVWRTDDSERADRILSAYDGHCPHPRLGSALGPALREAGLRVERVEPNTIIATEFPADSYAFHLVHAVRDYVVDQGQIDARVADAWVEDLRKRADRDEFFFSLTQYLYVVAKPAAAPVDSER